MKFKTVSKIIHTLDDDTQVELSYEPVGHLEGLVHRFELSCESPYGKANDKLVVAYLTDDNNGSSSSPMEEGSGNGVLHLTDYRLGTEAVRKAMHFPPFGPDVDEEFVLGEETVTLRTLSERAGAAMGVQRSEVEIGNDAHDLYSEHWQDIVGPYVIPVDYCENVHGPGTSQIRVDTSWDGELKLPLAVWVADKGAIECIESIESKCLPAGVEIKWHGALGSDSDPLYACVYHDGEVIGKFRLPGAWGFALSFVHAVFGRPTSAALRLEAEKYAASVLEQYEMWCNGEVYGCVVETFQWVQCSPGKLVQGSPGKWERLTEDSCWGFIGQDHAEQSLKSDFFEPAVAAINGKEQAQ